MHFKLFFLIIFSILSLASCNVNLFQPPPYPYENWEKKGTSFEEIERIMVECGYFSPYIIHENSKPNDIALIHLCMEKNGFKYLADFGTYCHQYPTLPACIEAAAAKKAAG